MGLFGAVINPVIGAGQQAADIGANMKTKKEGLFGDISPEKKQTALMAGIPAATGFLSSLNLGYREDRGAVQPGFSFSNTGNLAAVGTGILPGLGTAIGAGAGLIADTAKFLTGKDQYRKDLRKIELQDFINRVRLSSARGDHTQMY